MIRAFLCHLGFHGRPIDYRLYCACGYCGKIIS